MNTGSIGVPSMPDLHDYDVVVIGSGAGGLAAAVTAGINGLRTVIVEKDSQFGGTTATSGGAVWIPCSTAAERMNISDSILNARTYLEQCARKYGSRFDSERVDAYLQFGPRMMTFMERNTRLQWGEVSLSPDYHPELQGASLRGRNIHPAAYDAKKLPRDMRANLKWPWTKITFMGIQVSAGSREQFHFYHASGSPRSAAYVARLVIRQAYDLLVYGRSRRLVNGNALVAQLAATCRDLQIPILLSTPAVELIREDGVLRGATVLQRGRRVQINAARGVVLASGGFSYDTERRRALFAHERRGASHFPIGAATDTGDGARMAEAVGADFRSDQSNLAAWAPVTPVRTRHGRFLALPHQRTYAKPGTIAVTRKGVRFTNDACAYHDMVQAMFRECSGEKDVEAFVICDHRTLRRYGLGIVVLPYPFPLRPHLKSGYLVRGRTIAELAQRAGINTAALIATVDRFNHFARDGKDDDFHRGESEFDRCQGDPSVKPNPSLAPIEHRPFYALRMVPGDTGTFAGLRTNSEAQVLDKRGNPIPGLYAVGNDMESIFAGDYPGGGITIGPALTFGYIAGMHVAGKRLDHAPPAEEGPTVKTAHA